MVNTNGDLTSKKQQTQRFNPKKIWMIHEISPIMDILEDLTNIKKGLIIQWIIQQMWDWPTKIKWYL